MARNKILILIYLFFVFSVLIPGCYSESEHTPPPVVYTTTYNRRLIKLDAHTGEWSYLCTIDNCDHMNDACEMRHPVTVFSVYDLYVFYVIPGIIDGEIYNYLCAYDIMLEQNKVLYVSKYTIQKPHLFDGNIYFTESDNIINEKK